MYQHICKNCGKSFESYVKTSKYCCNECKFNGRDNHLHLEGKRFGRLTVLHMKKKENKKERVKWVCQCDCGNITSVQTNHLTAEITKSCGCLQKEFVRSRKQFKNTDFSFLHKKNNNLKVIGFSGYKLICQCDCGNIIDLYPSDFLSGHIKSCGCLKSQTSANNLKKARSTILKDKTNIAKIAKGKPFRNNQTTGIKGVYKNSKGQYVARIGFQYKKIYLGTYSSSAKAENARKKAEEKYYQPILDKYKKQLD